MRRSRLLVVVVLASAPVITGVAAGRQFAMLVELTPQQAVEGGTLTEDGDPSIDCGPLKGGMS